MDLAVIANRRSQPCSRVERRVPFDVQRFDRVDPVCCDFPELKLILRHGGEPWEALAVKLLPKWPNLYFSTRPFAPKHSPKAIVDFSGNPRRVFGVPDTD